MLGQHAPTLGRSGRRVGTESRLVVVGFDAEQMTGTRFLPSGRIFPVFLHPETQRNTHWRAPNAKTGPVQRIRCSPPRLIVTLSSRDLARRSDLTSNAMALDVAGTLIGSVIQGCKSADSTLGISGTSSLLLV
jgi:hypothetical protein